MRRGALSPATAVALLAAAVETLFRRETRWAGLRELASELELPRECECLEGRLEATEPTEERLVGREISWSGSQRRYLAEAGADQETYPGGRHDVLGGGGEELSELVWSGECCEGYGGLEGLFPCRRWEEECVVCGGDGEQLCVDGQGGARLGASCPCKRTLKGS